MALRFVTSVEDPAGTGYTEASFIVENGMAGAQPALTVRGHPGLAEPAPEVTGS
jgi:hypothetical protein